MKRFVTEWKGVNTPALLAQLEQVVDDQEGSMMKMDIPVRQGEGDVEHVCGFVVDCVHSADAGERVIEATNEAGDVVEFPVVIGKDLTFASLPTIEI